MRLRSLSVLLVSLLVGCQGGKSPQDKEVAQKHWSEARATVLYSLAQDQYKAHDFDKCKETLAQALKISPEGAPLHTLSAKVSIEQGQLELAEKELELARKYSPREPEPYYLSGVVYQRWQKPVTALEFYRLAAERAPAELPYVLAQSEMLVALNRVPEALALLQAKVAYFENSGSIRDAVGQLLMQSGRYVEAIDVLREAAILSEERQADSVRERLAMACFYANHYRECAQTLNPLLEKEPFSKRADLFAMRGECLMNLDDVHGARRSFETATELNPLSARYWQSLGRAALQVGDYKRAEFALHRSIGIEASLAESHLLIGYVHLKEGKYAEALTSFRQASDLDSADTVSLCMVGYTYEKMGRPELASSYYARAMKLRPGDDMARQLMAEIDK